MYIYVLAWPELMMMTLAMDGWMDGWMDDHARCSCHVVPTRACRYSIQINLLCSVCPYIYSIYSYLE